MSIDSFVSKYHHVEEQGSSRRIAYTQLGDFSAKHIFLCLPGLLEIRDSFNTMMSLVTDRADCCWISIDYCGRGDSDHLLPKLRYATSVYLSDVEDFVRHALVHQPTDKRRLHIIGTSMGGIVAMHLAYKLSGQVNSLILNDIGLNLHWSALIALYQDLKNTTIERDECRFDPRLLREIHSPAHFDLPYDFDLMGMNFHNLLRYYNGKIILLHNAGSKICPTSIAQEAKIRMTHLVIWTQDGDSHPAAWDKACVTKLVQTLKLKASNSLPSSDSNVLIKFPASLSESCNLSVQPFLHISKTYLNRPPESLNGWFKTLLLKIKSLRQFSI